MGKEKPFALTTLVKKGRPGSGHIMEPVDLSIPKNGNHSETDYSKPIKKSSIFRPYEEDTPKNEGNEKIQKQILAGNDNFTAPATPNPISFKSPPHFIGYPNGSGPFWPNKAFPGTPMDCGFGPSAGFGTTPSSLTTAYQFWGHHQFVHPSNCFYLPPFQWYQKRISRPLCGKYVKNGPAASRVTLMALRQRILQRQQMRYFLHSMARVTGRKGDTRFD